MSLTDRFVQWWNAESNDDPKSPQGKGETYAIRGDKALVCFDEKGYFLLIREDDDNPLDPQKKIVVKDPLNGETADIYMEPSWLFGYYESLGTE